jgi:hypothetical protein
MTIFFDQCDGLSMELLGQTRMETQTMIKRPSIFFIKKNKKTNEILVVKIGGAILGKE